MTASMLEKIPELSDAHLESLLANVQRLSTQGTTAQQNKAKEMLPAIEAETRQRSEAKSALLRSRAAGRSKARKSAKAAAEDKTDTAE